MIASEKKRFDALYDKHRLALKLQGMSASTIDVYSRAGSRDTDYFDCVPDQLSGDQLVAYFGELIDRNGVQFFFEAGALAGVDVGADDQATAGAHLARHPQRVGGRTAHRCGAQAALSGLCPDHLFDGAALSEALLLQISDIDAGRSKVHIQRG